jgi:hypothetical protein
VPRRRCTAPCFRRHENHSCHQDVCHPSICSSGHAQRTLCPPGAGRKPNIAKRLLSGVKPVTAAEALEGVDVQAIVHDLLKNGSRPVKLQTLTVLWDRIFGKPKQDVSVSGAFVHAHTRDPFLASLPKEALEALARSYDELLAKYRKPVLDVAQDGPHDQKESNTAFESEVMESEATSE